jgi:uncharacterized protein (TIGR03382 family)
MALVMGRELALVVAGLVILATAIVIATAYPSHAYRTAAPTSTVHTYCMTVGSFEAVSAPLQVERWWGLRAGSLGAGGALALGLLTTAWVLHKRRVTPVTPHGPEPSA